MSAHLGLSGPGDVELRRRAAAELADLGDRGDTEARWESAFLRTGLALIDADRDAFDAAVASLRAYTPRVKERDRRPALLQVDCVDAFLRGDLAGAERLAAAAFEAHLTSYSAPMSIAIYAALLFPVLEVQGRLGELAGQVDALVDGDPGFLTWRAVAAAIACASGDRTATEHHLAHLAATGFAFVEDLTWTAIAAMTCGPVHAVGDADAARLLYERLAPFAGQMTWNGLSTHGPVDAGLALLAEVLGDDERVRAHRLVARALVTSLRAPHLGSVRPASRAAAP